jgi:GntR family transcriptional repressor for pyruvate dehydrogenase complex
MLDSFTAIKKESPSDKVIKQIRDLIASGDLKPGDRLPAERSLAEKMGVSRAHLRIAIQKLEFYGILKTLPQSGTIVAGIGLVALEGLITDVLDFEESDFTSLVETRVILETSAAKLAAERRTEEDITELKKAIDAYEKKLKDNEIAVEEDLMFHLKIAEASKNSVLKSLMLIITPDIVDNNIKYNVCNEQTEFKAFREHQQILKCIIDQDGEAASLMMQEHLKDVLEFSISTKSL